MSLVTNLAEFYITDGSTFINLLSRQNGFAIQDWTPITPEPKDGGTWQDSKLSEGRRLVSRQLNNSIESLTLAGRGGTADLLIQESQRIRRLLEKGIDYWTSEWQNTPVYVAVRGINESNVRFCIIFDYRAPGDGNPFASPFTGPDAAIFAEWALIIEHDAWTDTPPGESTAVQVSGMGTFNGVEYGRAATTTNEVYVSNKQNKANLTHIYSFSTDEGWSSNLFGAAVPYGFWSPLVAANLAVNDAIYFICDTSVTDSGPFASLVFDLLTALSGTGITTIWEYWNGAAAVTLTTQDNTRTGTVSLAITGVNSVHWLQPSTWAADTLIDFSADAGAPVVTGFMIRLRVTAVTVGATLPVQQNRQPYTITWANVAIDDAQVGGDIPALARHKIYTQSGTESVLPDLLNQRTLIGLRSASRGSSFVPCLNWSDEQNPTGVTASAITSAAVSMVTDARAPTGRAVQFNSVGSVGPVEIAAITFSAAVSPSYYGRYRAFLRLTVDTGTADALTLQLFWGPTLSITATAITPLVTLSYIDEWLFVDMGQIVLPNTNVLDTTDLYPAFFLILKVQNTASTNLKLYDLCLLPIDEWGGDFVTTLKNNATAIEESEYLDADSIFFPRAPVPVRAIQRDEANDQVLSLWQTIANQPIILQANADQNVHFLSAILDASSAKQQSFGYVAHFIQTERVQRYLSMRGSR